MHVIFAVGREAANHETNIYVMGDNSDEIIEKIVPILSFKVILIKKKRFNWY